jgi:hypothetical protein
MPLDISLTPQVSHSITYDKLDELHLLAEQKCREYSCGLLTCSLPVCWVIWRLRGLAQEHLQCVLQLIQVAY